MTRSPRLIATIVLLLAAALPGQDRPNIIFIFSDDHAAHAIGAYGSAVNATPNIDRIAAEGMLFRNCMVTNAICGPARAVIQTGKHSHLNGFRTNADRFDGAQQTFPKLLQEAGYQTAVHGKWHLGSEPQGFDDWQVLIGQGPYYNPKIKSAAGVRTIEGYTTEIITDISLEWLQKKRDPSKPFMLMCQHKAPHRNWMPGPKYLHMYDDVEIPEPPTLFDDWKGKTAAQTQEMTVADHLTDHDLKLAPQYGLTEEQQKIWDAAYGPKNEAFRKAGLTGRDLVRWKYQRYMKDYLRCVAAVDDEIGRMLDWLEESDLADNTIVIYASDQGWYLGDHGWYDKRWMYEESLRMPFVVKWPGVTEPGSRNDLLVSNLDFAETFLDLAGVEIPKDMQGKSLVPLLRGERPESWRKSIYYHYYEFPGVHSVRRHYGVRTATHKLIHFYGLDDWELYDLVADPDEMHDLHGQPGQEKIRDELRAELLWLRALYAVPEDVEPPAVW